MKIKKVILQTVLRVLFVFACLQPVNSRRIVFVTLTSAELKDDFKLISDYICKKDLDVEIKYILTRFEKNLIGDCLYFLNCIKQIFLINSSKVVVINDNNFVVSNFKRKDVQVVQIWHACGAVKKFGNEIQRQYRIRNYDYVISSSSVWKDIYSRSFGVRENQVIPLGMARTDVLYDLNWRKLVSDRFYKRYPVLQNRYIILYVPTFRGNIIDGLKYEEVDLPRLLKTLPEDTVILYRMHPLLKQVKLEEGERIINVSSEELNELLVISDCMVTDYSSVVFDYSLLDKKIVLYVPDVEHYRKTLGLNLELDCIPGAVCMTQEELSKELSVRTYSINDIKKFKNRYAEFLDGNSTCRIGDFIISLIKEK